MRRGGRRGRAGVRGTVRRLLGEIPRFLRLLTGLMLDRRVSRLDKALVAGVIAYILTPVDLLPDVLGFLGLTDDLYLLGLALTRLLGRAGPEVLLDHWRGRPDALAALLEGVESIGSLLPRPIRRLVRRRVEALDPGA